MESENLTNAGNLSNDASVINPKESIVIVTSDSQAEDKLVGSETAQGSEKATTTNVGAEAAARVDVTDADHEAISESGANAEDGTNCLEDSGKTNTSSVVESPSEGSSRSENAGPHDSPAPNETDDGLLEVAEQETKQNVEETIGNDDDEQDEVVDEVSENESGNDASEGDKYEDEDSRDVIEGEHDEIRESGSEPSPAEDEDEIDEGVEEYDSEDQDERGMDVEPDDEDDDDVAVISDTTVEDDEEEEAEDDDGDRDRSPEGSDRRESNVCDQLYDDSEVESEASEEDYGDDDDLMNDIILSRRVDKHRSSRSSKYRETKEKERRFKNAKVTKRSPKCDWRLKLKKRSVKWLKSARMRNVSESQGDVGVLNYLASKVPSTPSRSQKLTENPVPFIISQVTSIANEKDSSYSSKVPSQSQVTAEMQQINKIQECVKRSSQDDCQEIKQSGIQQNKQLESRTQAPCLDENNKENIGENEKKATSLSKINGTAPSDAVDGRVSNSAATTKDVVNIDESDEMDVMEISDEPLGETSSSESVNATVINTKNIEYVKSKIKEESTCDIKSVLLESENKDEKQGETEIIDKKINEDTMIDKNTDEDSIPKIILNTTEQHPKQQTDLPQNATSESCLKKETIEKAISHAELRSTKSSTVHQMEAVTPAESTGKRSRTPGYEEKTEIEDVHPAKKLKSQVDANFATHDEILNEYIERTSNNSIDDIQKHLGQLIVEIQTLNDMIKAKETEWNNLLHLKKVKEEICLRLTRKKQVLDIISTKVGQVNDGGGDTNFVGSYLENLNNLASDIGNNKFLQSAILAATGSYASTTISPVVSTPLATSKSMAPVGISSTPNSAAVEKPTSHANLMNNLSNISAISSSGIQSHQQLQNCSGNSIGSSLVQNILQNRANMKTSDLVKEKATTQRLHRILVSRNILPKPSTATSATGFTTNGDLSSNNVSLSLLTKNASIAMTSSLNATTITSVSSLATSNTCTPMNLTNSNSGCQISSLNEHQPILNNYLTASATATLQKQLGEMLNGHHNFRSGQDCGNVTNGVQTLGFGRQGAFKDVKSIIEDYRQKHPEVVPRRGRRVKTSSSLANMHQGDATTILGNVLKSDSRSSTDLGALLAKVDGNSRPSSNDSSHSATNPNNNMISGNMSFKDVLIQFAKMSEQNNADRSSAALNAKSGAASGLSNGLNAPFPEVTLHPVTTMHSSLDQGAGSLLHGILTKFNRPNVSNASSLLPTSTTSASYNNTFSPTLARLLTAPERITSATNSIMPSFQQSQTSGTHANTLNISKMVSGHNSEITITPVVSAQQVPTLLQQQLEHQQQQQHQISLKRERIKLENLLNAKDDEADDSIDRLVIDEGGDSSMGAEDTLRLAPNAFGLEFNENEVPACQGCKKNEAQFVCAGCANQLYCSRECQVAAWDEHSEVCTG